ncbi:LysR family transcriptional regulator [Vibrio parahaemolyticus]|nr:LysR family transcriptional regulator [Vibrio parahaemolyticus]
MKTTSEQLQAFVAVYEQNSFSGAANQLSRHRSSVSQIISFLEDSLEIQLFERRGRVVTPTGAATELYFYAKQAIDHSKAFENLAGSLHLNKLTKLTIGYSELVPRVVLVNLRQELEKVEPGLSVNFHRTVQMETQALLEMDEIQFAIVEVDERDSTDRLERAFLTHMFFSVMASKHHELARIPPSERFEALRSLKQIVFYEQLKNPYNINLLLSAKHEVVNDLDLMFALIDEGVGWGVLPKTISYLHQDYRNIVNYEVDDLKEAFHIPFALWNKHDHRLRLLRKVILENLMKSQESIFSLKSV